MSFLHFPLQITSSLIALIAYNAFALIQARSLTLALSLLNNVVSCPPSEKHFEMEGRVNEALDFALSQVDIELSSRNEFSKLQETVSQTKKLFLNLGVM